MAEAGLMRYFLDTEFIEDGKTIELISIGIVAEDGRELYLENLSCDLSRASDWVQQNVVPQLDLGTHGVAREEIPLKVLQFVDGGAGKPEFWGYYADYDWVVLCQMFGTMMDLPKGWPMCCMDLKQFAMSLGNPRLVKQGGSTHHALADAKWVAGTYKILRDDEAARQLRAIFNDAEGRN
jgi:hypothetical protein